MLKFFVEQNVCVNNTGFSKGLSGTYQEEKTAQIRKHNFMETKLKELKQQSESNLFDDSYGDGRGLNIERLWRYHSLLDGPEVCCG